MGDPKTDPRMPRQQVGGCEPLGQREFRIFNYTCPSISGTLCPNLEGALRPHVHVGRVVFIISMVVYRGIQTIALYLAFLSFHPIMSKRGGMSRR